MKILETTAKRLVIQREKSSDAAVRRLVLWVNLIITICFVAVSKSLTPLDKDYSLALFFIAIAIGWLLIHLLFPVNRQENSFSYCFAVVFGSFPFLGVIFLSLAAIDPMLNELELLENITLTFDKNENLLTIKSKFLFWYRTTEYPLDEIIQATLSTRSVYSGLGIVNVPVVQLTRRRRRDGNIYQKEKIYQKDILFGPKEVDYTVVNLINRFLQ